MSSRGSDKASKISIQLKLKEIISIVNAFSFRITMKFYSHINHLNPLNII